MWVQVGHRGVVRGFGEGVSKIACIGAQTIEDSEEVSRVYLFASDLEYERGRV